MSSWSVNACGPQIVAANLSEAMRFFGRARPHGEVREEPGVCLVHCGLPYAAFNAAVMSESLRGGQDLCRRILVAGSYFGQRNLPWTCWICNGFLEDGGRNQSTKLLKQYGLSPLTTATGMMAENLAPPARRLPFLDVRWVQDAATRQAFAQITSAGFETPGAVCKEIYGAERAWSGSFEGYIGYSDGKPVCSAAIVVTAEAVGLYSVATLPPFRNRGFGEAIVRTVLAQARARTGIQTSVLQSTSSGLRLYERLGYKTVTQFRIFIS